MSSLFDPTQPVQQPAPKPDPTQPTWGQAIQGPTPPPKKPHRARKIFLLGLLAVVVLFVIVAVLNPAPTTTASGPNVNATASAEPVQATTAAPAAPTVKSYDLTVKTLSKQCYGSAGCNLQARITVTALDATALNQTVDVTYRLTGTDDDSASVDTVRINEDGTYDKPELFLSTASSKTKVTAVITSVELVN